MNICVIGTGYVGLVTGVCLAVTGHSVLCIDNNAAKVKLMQSGQSPIYEPGLDELMQSAMQSGQLSFSTDLAAGVDHGKVIFIAVGTPALPTGESDTRAVEVVARGIGNHLNGGYKVIVNKSTVPIGSGDWVKQLVLDGVAERGQSITGFDVVSNPEFLREGSAIYDTLNPDRIVLGGNSDTAIQQMQDLYLPIIQRHCAEDPNLPPVPVVVTDLASAEMIKYAANSFLATKISFINEVANICDRVGADVTQVATGIGLDSRIGPKFLQAGIGWGGSCFPKDVAALIHTAADYGYDAPLLKAAVTTNRNQRLLVVEKLQQVLKILKGKTIGLLGLTFKPNTDDLRDAPAINMIAQLHRLGARVKAYDPLLCSGAHPADLEHVELVSGPVSLAMGCDALVLVTDWQEILSLDFGSLAAVMPTPILVDGRNALDPKTLVQAGFQYVGMGRPTLALPRVQSERQLQTA
ncbi:UDP-glucose/GDP-mannose dehydrogenase family protein [Acaryochloris sp. IP29b_bin.148]|uniref:UDP-glucose dehydrogenase family protein n=1 Tax=Acaryochloris sp. IP29b_bin.148 TaxID=2969218 RepID=UPI00260DBD3D|nr:UDP-glucose/GDP-mannose dehydrogenase family protein [Acaryochloris sp. IP29b_bin.148]